MVRFLLVQVSRVVVGLARRNWRLVLQRLADVPLPVAVSIAWWLLALHLPSLREVYRAVNQGAGSCRAHLIFIQNARWSLWRPATLALSLLLLIVGLRVPWLRDLLRQRTLAGAGLSLEVRPGRRAAACFFLGPRGLVRLVNLRDIDPRSLDHASFLVLELP